MILAHVGTANESIAAGDAVDEALFLGGYTFTAEDDSPDFDATDSDGDGLPDVIETEYTHTDPLNPDTDQDGLTDGQEAELKPDPRNPDSDNDRLPDGKETPPCPSPIDSLTNCASCSCVRERRSAPAPIPR